jgi:hypothetical protein
VGESLKVHPTARLPGPLNNRPGSLVVTTAKLPDLRGSELKLSSLMVTTGLLFQWAGSLKVHPQPGYPGWELVGPGSLKVAIAGLLFSGLGTHS